MSDVVESGREAFAIIGLGCRFPGAASPAEFWRLLAAGEDAISDIPPDRFDAASLYDPRPSIPGRIASQRGGFLPGIDRFDAAFFGMSPREAERLDPQQRLLLELAWEAFEDAGLVKEQLAGSATGVFVGMWLSDYEARLFADPSRVDFHMTTGSGRYTASGRLSHVFGLHGPSLTLDTACSSSLVAVHLACQSLRSGETTLALAAGVNVILQPQITIAYSQSRMMAPDGRCKFGDAAADGYVRSEGAGVVVLKRLGQALADGDPIRAVILGSAVNNDGGSGGSLGTPGRAGQEDLLRRAYRAAGIAPSDVDYVEVHGTGTVAGDPVELQALATVLGEGRHADRPLLVGSVKTNIGHTEGAAGMAGLIKTVLAFEHAEIPASLHLGSPNPSLAWDRLPVVVQRTLGPWPRTGRPARAGVSSFGIAGTNAHIVLEATPARAGQPEMDRSVADEAPRLLPLSAHTPGALTELASAWREFLRDPARADILAGVGYTAAVRRNHQQHRLAVIGKDATELADNLDGFVRGEPGGAVEHGVVSAQRAPRVAFVFPGQGSQWSGMGRRLLRAEPVFKDALLRCDAAIAKVVGWSVLADLEASEANGRLERIEVVQPALFAIQVALAALWRSWGVEPVAVIGHSMGEVAAAHVAGGLDLDDAARVIGERSRLLQTVSGHGGMAVVELSLDETRVTLAGHEDRLSIAVSNSARSTVIAGDNTALDEVLTDLESRGVFCRRVKVDVASHSPQVDPLLPALEALLAGLQPRAFAIPLCSTVSGEFLDTGAVDARYWVRNLRQPVLFAAGVRRLLEHGITAVIEISPHPILLPTVREALPESVLALPSSRRAEDESRVMLGSLASLYAVGQSVNWRRLWPGRRPVSLPSYPWQRERFWYAAPAVTPGGHPLLGQRLDLADAPGTTIWQTAIDAQRRPELYEHRLHGRAVLAASAYVEILTAALDVDGVGSHALTDLQFLRPLYLDADGETRLQITAQRLDGDRRRLHVHARVGDSWIPHVTATSRLETTETAPQTAEAEIVIAGDEIIPARVLQQRCAKAGVTFASPTALTGDVVRVRGGAVGSVTEERASVWASVLDGCFQMALVVANAGAANDAFEVFLPSHLASLQMRGDPRASRRVHAQVRSSTDAANEAVVADVWVTDDHNRSLAELLGLRLQRLGVVVRGEGDCLFEVAWRSAASAGPATAQVAAGWWLLLADTTGIAQATADRLAASGRECVLVWPGEKQERVGMDRWRIRVGSDDLRDLAATLMRERGTPPVAIVHLWALDLGSAVESFGIAPVVWQSVSDLARVLADLPDGWPGRGWLITRGAQVVGRHDRIAVEQAPTWGLGRVISAEQSGRWSGLVDLDPTATVETCAGALVSELLGREPAPEAAFRAEQRYVPRLTPVAATRCTPGSVWRRDGTYIITGGLGGVGLAVAHWLVGQGVRRLLLMGRTPMPPRGRWRELEPGPLATRTAAVMDLERAGASVHAATVDVGDRQALTAFLARFEAEGWPPIRGVFHAAAAVDDRRLTELDPGTLARVMHAKAVGAWYLHEALADELDCFVLFSSIGSLLGQPGQGAYAAANAFLDALAHHRRAEGRPALVVNWAVWRDVGLASGAGGRRIAAHLERQGIGALDVAQALDALGRALADDHTQLVAAPIDRTRLRGAGDGDRPLLAELVARAEDDAIAAASPSLRDLVLTLGPTERRPVLEDAIRSELSRILKLPAARIERERPLGTLGVDSLMALELRRRLEALLGVTLTATLVWNHPTVADLGAFLGSRLDPAPVASPPSVPGPAAAAGSAAVAALSEEEALKALLGES